MDYYFDAVLFQNSSTTTELSQTKFNYALNQPITEMRGSYKVGVVQASIPTFQLPLMYFDSNWAVGIVYNNADLYESKCTFVPSSNLASDTSEIKTVGQLLDIINEALYTCATALNVDHPATITQTPIFIVKDGVVSFFGGSELYTPGTVKVGVSRGVLNAIGHAFDTFKDYNFAFSGNATDYFNTIDVEYDLNNQVNGSVQALTIPSAGGTKVLLTQRGNINLNKIVSIRVLLEDSSIQNSKNINNDATLDTNQSVSLQSSKCLVECYLNEKEDRFVKFFEPVQYHDLISDIPLQRFSIHLEVIDSANVVHPFVLPVGEQIRLKLNFKVKNN